MKWFGVTTNMKKIFNDFIEAFNNKSETGMSGRKLTAFWFAVLATYINIKHSNDANSLNFLITDCIVVLLALAIILPDHLIKLKNGNNGTTKE